MKRVVAALLTLTLLIGMFSTNVFGVGYKANNIQPRDAFASQKAVEAGGGSPDGGGPTLSEVDLSKYEVSGALKAMLDSKGVSASKTLTVGSAPVSNDGSEGSVAYVESVAEALVNAVGIVGIDGEGGEIKEAFVWTKELPGALEKVYQRRGMNVRGYFEARADGQKARANIRSRYGLQITDEYSEVFSGFAIIATVDQLAEIARMDGVYAITEVGYYYIPDPGYEVVGNAAAREIWDIGAIHAVGIDGAGVKVGILDSGIQTDHPDLADAYKGGYDFAQNSARMDRPDGDHGTHVAGIIASQGIVSLGMAPGVEFYMAQVFRPGSTGASEANINSALEAFTTGTHQSGLPRVDVINMSLGNNVNTAYSAAHFARNNVVVSGIVLVNSAGNNGYPDGDTTGLRNNYSIGSGGVSLPISVAASRYGGNPILTYSPTAGNGDGSANSEPFEVFIENGDAAIVSGIFRDNSFGNEATHVVTWSKTSVPADVNFPYPGPTYTIKPLVFVEGKGYELYYACANNVPSPPGTNASDMTLAELTALNNLPAGFLEGKILVVNRGQNFFDYKGQALRLGAGGLIVINRFDEIIGNLNIGAETSARDLLIFSAKSSLKQVMYDLVAGGQTAYLDPGLLGKIGHLMEPTGYSSIGPVNETAEIKPDLIAPGFSVLSTTLGDGYVEKGGTSMSSPAVAGLAALLLQKYPGASPAEIKARLMNTSDPFLLSPSSTNKITNGTYYFDQNGTELSVWEQGAGFPNPCRAIMGDDVFITVDNYVPTGQTSKATMLASMASFSFGQVAQGETTDALTAVVHGGTVDSIEIRYNHDTRYSNKNLDLSVEVFYENFGDSFDVWLVVGEEANSDAKAGGNLYEGYVIATIDGEEYILPWGVRVGEALPEDDWLLFPDRPVQAANGTRDIQDWYPYSQQNYMYFMFQGDDLADTVVLRRTGTGSRYTYFLDIYLIDAVTEQPAYRYQIQLNSATTNNANLKLSDFLWCDGRVYQVNVGPTAMARNANGTWATTASAIRPGSYYVAFEFNEGRGNFFNWYLQLGLTYTNVRPTLTVELTEEDFELDDDYYTFHDYAYGADCVTINGRMYSAGLEEAKGAGRTGFYWAGLFILVYDVIIELDQSWNVLEDALTGWELEFFDEEFGDYSPYICDEDGSFSLTLPVNDDGWFFPEDICESGVAYVSDAFGPSQRVSNSFADYGCLVSYMWAPLTFEADAIVERVEVFLNGTVIVHFAADEGLYPAAIDPSMLSVGILKDGALNGLMSATVAYQGYKPESGTAIYSFSPKLSYSAYTISARASYESRYGYSEAISAEIEGASLVSFEANGSKTFVTKLSGNTNLLTVVVDEYFKGGAARETIGANIVISNNSADVYEIIGVDDFGAAKTYFVYVDTKGNIQIRDCRIVSEVQPTPPAVTPAPTSAATVTATIDKVKGDVIVSVKVVDAIGTYTSNVVVPNDGCVGKEAKVSGYTVIIDVPSNTKTVTVRLKS